MAVQRRTAVAAPAPKGGSVNLGDDALYSGGGQFDLPPGKYALEASTQNFTSEKGKTFLCVMMNFHPLEGGEPIAKPLSLGQKASLSFAPSEDGLGFEPIPGAPATTMPSISNWGIFRKSLIDSGLPPGYLSNDVSVLNGTWVQTDNQENEERKKMRAQPKVGEAAGDPAAQRNFDDKSVVVTEILEGGRPWEGTGGFDFPAAAAAPKPTAVKAPARPGPRAAAPAPVEAPAEEEEGLDVVVQAGIGSFLEQEKNAHGCTKLQLRAAVFSYVSKAMGDDSAQEAGVTYFGAGSDAALKDLLTPLGYTVVAGQIKPA